MISVEFLLLSLGLVGFCGMVHFTMQPGYLKRLMPRISTQEENKVVLQHMANDFLSKVIKGDASAILELTTRINDPTWKYFGAIIDLKEEAKKIIEQANEGDPPARATLESVMGRPKSRYFGMVRRSAANPERFEFVDRDANRLDIQVKDPDSLWHSSGPAPLKGSHPGRLSKLPMGDKMA